ncbi:unnamed protein product [Bursaphelenchus xylophilus]|uniref:(pine wood nematode) hypothetical protein n=1 Tax=Bursaphelenchus xylophilus TaxID=6326 RepID=A0A1I7SCQ7_BURXY|nr:unnamed protein product [Bursaphelenchus xylophilus]CAG9093673.1 unnamed protein product [Bursaphelenchus xylophilus]
MAPTPARSFNTHALDKLSSAIWEPETAMSITPMRKSKIILLGNSGVGKTSLLYSHKYGPDVTPCSATIGASYVNCEMTVQDDPIQLQIWDTAGQERYRCMIPMYLRNAIGAILVYDITDRRSFDEIHKWLQDLERYAVHAPLLMLVGSKADMTENREVSRLEGEAKAAKLQAQFYELSAFDPKSIDKMLYEMATRIHERQMLEPPETKQVELIRVQPWRRSPLHSPTSSGQMSPTSSEDYILSSNASFGTLASNEGRRAEEHDEEEKTAPCCSIM